MRRLMPFMIAMYLLNFLDRVNISFAALQMNQDLGFSPEIYGFAAGILFVGYVAFEVPSNVILSRVGARVWLARIMIMTGLLATCMAFVSGKYSLYTLRALVGVAEAGFFPGVLYYLMRWFPAQDRAKAVTMFMLGNPVAVIFGAPLSTFIMGHFDKTLGLAGWQWLFIVQGLPTVLIGIAALWWLTEKPEEAKWLAKDERDWLTGKLAEEAAAKRLLPMAQMSKWTQIFTHWPTLAMSLCKFSVLTAFFGLTLWLPQILKSMGDLSTTEIGFLTAVPYVFAAVTSVVIGRHSDKTGERTYHIAIPALIGAVAFVVAGLTIGHPVVALVAMCFAATGLWVANTVFWTLPSSVLGGTAAAAGLALINTIGNLGGFVGPYITGWAREFTGSYTVALAVLGSFLVLDAVLVIMLGRKGIGGAGGRPVPSKVQPEKAKLSRA
jgi:ACS family tartrate transporter-like MFS transporter